MKDPVPNQDMNRHTFKKWKYIEFQKKQPNKILQFENNGQGNLLK